MKNSAVILTGCLLICLGAGCSSLPSSDRAKQNGIATTDPIMELPPLRGEEAKVENWMNACGCHWEKKELAASARKLLCIQLMPYSGMPGIHVFVYENRGEFLSLVFCAIISSPPHFEKGQPLAFTYDGPTDSIGVSSDGVQCLHISLSSL